MFPSTVFAKSSSFSRRRNLVLVDKMSVEVYSECRIQVPSNDGQLRTFDRCLIELRQYDIGAYALRTIDLNNNKLVRIDDRSRYTLSMLLL